MTLLQLSLNNLLFSSIRVMLSSLFARHSGTSPPLSVPACSLVVTVLLSYTPVLLTDCNYFNCDFDLLRVSANAVSLVGLSREVSL